MGRKHLFEFCDQPWLPRSLRDGSMDLLRLVMRITQVYKPSTEVLRSLMQRTGENQLVVLAAGSGGGIMDLLPLLPGKTRVVLSDLFPPMSFKIESQTLSDRVHYWPQSVNALSVPPELKGIRVLFTSFHHFKPQDARALLADAVQHNQPIALFEVTERSLKGFLTVLAVPFLAFILTPFVRPVRWSQLFFTYIVPAIPVLALWDGWVSCLRSYTPEEVLLLVQDFDGYYWETQKLHGPHGENVASIIGFPKEISKDLWLEHLNRGDGAAATLHWELQPDHE